MDSSQNHTAKSQRNPKKQRDRKRLQEKETETLQSPKPVDEGSKGHEPQPQRANRRQRNEPTKNSNASEVAPAVVQEKKETAENVIVDHSNLKRETEEIAKLKKKFTKREITSNWHRYSAPEGDEINQPTEENAPADFSDLLKVPVSMGGHLQLKEEKDWSSTSSQQLSGYFALDLKLLSQSLSCIPLYDQLRLPKHIFSEEEIKNFDAVADEAKKCYNPEKAEDTNLKGKSLTSLVSNESYVEETLGMEVNQKSSEDLNILDVNQSTNKVLNLKVEPEQCLIKQKTLTVGNTESDITGLTKIVNLNVNPDPVLVEMKPDSVTNKSINSNINRMFELEKIDIVKESVSDKPFREESSEKQVIFPQTANDNKIKEVGRRVEIPVALNDANNPKSEIFVSKELTNTIKDIHHNSFLEDEISQTLSESKEQRIRVSKNKSPEKQVNTNKLGDQFNVFNLEDDDLDVLLAMKTAEPEKTQAESKPADIKESSIFPGGRAKTQPIIIQNEHTELDDWLDSILED